MDVLLESIDILINTFCVCIDGFQDLSKTFHYNCKLFTTIVNFSNPSAYFLNADPDLNITKKLFHQRPCCDSMIPDVKRQPEMKFLDIKLTKDSRVFCSMLFKSLLLADYKENKKIHEKRKPESIHNIL